MSSHIRLIQPLSWAWDVKSADVARPAYYLRAQPAWEQDDRRRLILGWKAYMALEGDAEQIALSVRLDVGGGQTENETPNSRTLVTFDFPYAGVGSFFPITCFAAVKEAQSWANDGKHHMAYSQWPGLASCTPIWCSDTVRCLVRADSSMDPETVWSMQVNLTLWIGSE